MIARLVAVLGLCVALGASPVEGRQKSRSKRTQATNPRQLRGALSSVQRKQEQLRRELRLARARASAVKGDIREVDTRMNSVQQQYDHTSDRLVEGRQEQKTLAQRLKEASQQVLVVQAQVGRRLKSMYMEGSGSYLAALVGTESVGDMVSRRYVMERITEQDHALFTQYRQLRQEIATKKRRQDELVVEIGGLARRQWAQKRQLANVRMEKGEVLDALRQRQGDLQRLIAQLDADERRIRNEIAAYARRVRKPGERVLPPFKGRFMRPVHGPVTSTFGMRFHPILRYNRMHRGVDFGAAAGSPIYAVAPGIVFRSYYSSSFGNVVMIDHGDVVSLYAHCSARLVGEGATVKRGQVIGRVGATGLARGAHLHFEVHTSRGAVNPLNYVGR